MNPTVDPARDLSDWMSDAASATPPPPELTDQIVRLVARRGQRPRLVASAASPWPAVGDRADTRRVLASMIVLVIALVAAAAAVAIGSQLVRLLEQRPLPPDYGIVDGPTLASGRFRHSALRLADGRVAVFGCSETIEVLDPDAGAWSNDGSMISRCGPGVASLPDGRVLIAGGVHPVHQKVVPLDWAQIWDPSTGSTTDLPALAIAREGPTLIRLPDGRIIVAGGKTSQGGPQSRVLELFDPSTRAFTTLADQLPGDMTSATLLPDGTVLIVGVADVGQSMSRPWAEIVDPRSGRAMAIEPPSETGVGQAATALPNGRVMLIGGLAGPDRTPTSTVQVFDPATRRFTVTGHLASPRAGHTAVASAAGDLIVIGGRKPYLNGFQVATGTIEIVGPDSPLTRVIDRLPVDRTDGATATLLDDGQNPLSSVGRRAAR